MQTTISNYISTLIQEKGRSTQASIPAFESKGHIGLNYDVLIEFIQNNTSPEQKTQIHNTLTKIDFMNGDVFHYLDHLVSGMIKALGLEMFAAA